MSRLEKLKKLEDKLFKAMQECKPNEMAAISRQYRETLREIEVIEGTESDNDEIAEILSNRADNGKAGAVRKNRTKV